MTLSEIAKSKGKQVFIESALIPVADVVCEEIPASTRLTEAVNGTEYSCYAILRNLPVARYDEKNKNGRVYPLSIGKKIIQEGSAEGSLALADHPANDQDGSVRDIVGVWHNFRLEGNIGRQDLYLVEGGKEYGKLLFNAIRAGAKQVGISTVAFGELMEDGITVNPSTMEFIRSDLVLNPSASVYASIDNLPEDARPRGLRSESAPLSSTNHGEASSLSLKEEVKPLTEKSNKEGSPYMSDTLTKLTEAHLKNLVNASLKEANKVLETRNISLMQEKIADLQEQVIPLPEEQARVSAVISKLQEAIEAETARLSSEHSELGVKMKDLEEKYEAASKLAEGLQGKLRKAAAIIEKLGGSAENPERLQMVEDMKDDIQKFLEDRKNMKADIDVLLKERAMMLSDIKIFKEERKVMLSDIRKLVEDTGKRDSDIKNLLKDRKVMLEDLSQLVKDRKLMKEDMKQLIVDRKALKEDLQVARKKLKEAAVVENDPYKGMLDDVKPQAGFPYESGEDDQQIAQVDPAFARMAASSSHSPGLRESVEDLEPRPFTESRLQSQKLPVGREVKAFYESKVSEFPALEKVKDRVLSAKSLMEAVRIVEAFSAKDDGLVIRMNESTGFKANKKPSFLDGFL